ncbi:probable WRKY transcription factor 75 [Momordica charantia]|uniref:Probable WRKY transcription factor 75 n=1 Tax=Momordica charantia TaxID=3673 RepID=A0A6J1DS81_MOMCH|nr:probable WRKY transcription factor 75 [Momordica charantia]
MENYQMFFPCPGGALPPYHPDLPSAMDAAAAASPVFAGFHGGDLRSGGFLGLKTEVDAAAAAMAVVDADGNGSENYQISCDGGHEEGEVKLSKKKGEKKVRKPRYAFQTRSQVDILDDGYRWRKYGQKAVKNNKFPRSYYRCTHQGCNVKKQVQRLTRDEGVVVTTYEGMHTHPSDKPSDNFEQILSRMQIYSTPF